MPTLHWPYPRLLAHRGGGSRAPENTLAALRTGLAYGFKGVEFDTMLTADGVPVLMHDPEFGRTVAGSGQVARTPSHELTQRDAGAWFAEEFIGERVPTLAQAIAFCRTHRLWMNIEIKPSSEAVAHETGRVVGRLVAQLWADALPTTTDAGVRDPALPEFSSFSKAALHGVRETCPQLARGLLVTAIPQDWRQAMREVGAFALHARARDLKLEQVSEIHALGVPLMLYTVNDREHARELFSWGVDAICTDNLDHVDASLLPPG